MGELSVTCTTQTTPNSNKIWVFKPCLFLWYLQACQTLGVSQLDSVIIAPSGCREGDSQSLADLQPAWEELEALVRNQQIAAIGTSDLDKDLLEQLYNWADVSDNRHRQNSSFLPAHLWKEEQKKKERRSRNSLGICLLVGKDGSQVFYKRVQWVEIAFLERFQAHQHCFCVDLFPINADRTRLFMLSSSVVVIEILAA